MSVAAASRRDSHLNRKPIKQRPHQWGGGGHLVHEGPNRPERQRKDEPAPPAGAETSVFSCPHSCLSGLQTQTRISVVNPDSQAFGLRLNYITCLPGSSACRQQVVGLLGFLTVWVNSCNKSPRTYHLSIVYTVSASILLGLFLWRRLINTSARGSFGGMVSQSPWPSIVTSCSSPLPTAHSPGETRDHLSGLWICREVLQGWGKNKNNCKWFSPVAPPLRFLIHSHALVFLHVRGSHHFPKPVLRCCVN